MAAHARDRGAPARDRLSEVASGDLAARVEDLFVRQLRDWPLLAKGVAGLAAAETRALDVDGATVLARHVPHRAASTTAKVDAASVAKRPCFLCAENLDPAEEGLPFGADLTLYGNPFPILERHLTVVHREHRPQRVDVALPALLDLARALPGFLAVYNGPACGASAPDHRHLPAARSAGVPILADVASATGAALTSGARRALVLRGERDRVLDGVTRALDVLAAVTGAAPEPLVNLAAWRDGDALTAVVFPRGKHRPAVFHDGTLVVSPAAVDLCGVFVVPRPEDFARITGGDVAGVLREVALAEDVYRDVVARLGR